MGKLVMVCLLAVTLCAVCEAAWTVVAQVTSAMAGVGR